MPGSDECLPDHIKKAYIDAKAKEGKGKMQEVHAIVNSIVPRNSKYKSMVNFNDPAVLQKYERYDKTKTASKGAIGMSRSEVKGRLGGGQIGEQGIQEALQCGDLKFHEATMKNKT